MCALKQSWKIGDGTNDISTEVKLMMQLRKSLQRDRFVKLVGSGIYDPSKDPFQQAFILMELIVGTTLAEYIGNRPNNKIHKEKCHDMFADI